MSPFTLPLVVRPTSLLRRLAIAPVALLLLVALPARDAKAAIDTNRWPVEVIDLAATMPVQEGGRVMPLATLADYTLLKWNGRKSAQTAAKDGDTLSPTEVLLDVLFRPTVAVEYPLFVVDDAAVLDAVGLERRDKQKRDRYSYADLYDVRDEIVARADAIRARSRGEAPTSPLDAGIVELGEKIGRFEGLGMLLIVFQPYQGDDQPGFDSFFSGAKRARLSDVLRAAPSLAEASTGANERGKAASSILGEAQMRAKRSAELATVPPAAPASASPVWLAPGVLVSRALEGATLPPAHAALLDAYERCVEAAGAPRSAEPAFRTLHDRTVALAEARGEYDKIVLEVSLARLNPFGRSLYGYVLAFLLVAASWLKRHRAFVVGAWVVLLGSLALHITGVVLRCVIRNRPPMLNLYDTTLFIAAAVVIAALVIERISRLGVAFALAPVAGAVGLFVSGGYEKVFAEDTMKPPVAVLDTNFWLSTHVVCIAIGYSASLLSALFGNVYVLGKVFRLGRDDADFYRAVARMAYGVLCFALFFSIIGTILGGIWANESWGRFWGWDPKENGALAICLVQLMTLHARMGGIVKAFGVSMATIFCGIVVAGSWWGVNLLSIGLHSYGFAQGIWGGLLTFWGIEAAVVLAGFARWLIDRAATAAAA